MDSTKTQISGRNRWGAWQTGMELQGVEDQTAVKKGGYWASFTSQT